MEAVDKSIRDKLPILMTQRKLVSFSNNLFASRRYLILLLGVILVCIFTIIKLLTCESFKSACLPKDTTKHLNAPINLTESVRVLCFVQTSPNNAESKALHVKRTWGRRCNKLLLMSSKVNEKVGTIGLNTREGHNNLANKTFEAFQYIYEHHLNEYDWFLKADDDAYVIVENLRYFLYPYSPEFPIFFGSKLQKSKQVYLSGGPGYILSREAVRRFIEIAVKSPANCSSKAAYEDMEIGRCMEFVNVTAGDSRDCDERARIFPEPPKFFFEVNPKVLANRPNHWYNRMAYYQPYYGAKCCSDMAISFHYIKPVQMYVLDYLLYELHPYGVEYRNRDLLPKKTWEEAKIVAPGPYLRQKPTPKPKLTPKPKTAVTNSLPNDELDMAKMLVSDASIKGAKMDYLVDRLLSNNELKDKLAKKLKK